jgi:4'-phosphopantetheinyl transferase
VRTTLSRYADVAPAEWRFTAGEHGRPEIAPRAGIPPLRFNLAHTDGLIAMALTLHDDVGIDVEVRRHRSTWLDVARRFFAAAEVAALDALPADEQSEAFLDYWTLKEAYVKATGLGLHAPLQRFWFRRGTVPAIVFDVGFAEDPSAWQFARLHLGPDHVAALAVRRWHPPRVTCFMWSGQ